MDAAIVEKLKAANPDIHLVQHREDGAVVVEAVLKRPPADEFRKFRAQLKNAARKDEAPEQLVRACCVYPDAASLTEIFRVRVGLIDTWAGKLIDLAGLAEECESVPL
jgi:hypothetical protein